MSTLAAQQAIPQVNEAGQANDNNRPYGTFGCIGTAYGKIVANFYASNDPKTPVTVVVPSNLEKFVMAALEHKYTTLVSFEGGLKPYATISNIAIYN